MSDHLLALTADIVSAHVSNNSVAPDGVPALITSVFQTLSKVGTTTAPTAVPEPAVPVKKSVFPDHIVCLEDGKKLKMLKRHLKTAYNMTPEEYRVKWGLPASYPMVALNYAQTRSTLAKSIGLGRKRGDAFAGSVDAVVEPKAVKAEPKSGKVRATNVAGAAVPEATKAGKSRKTSTGRKKTS